MHLVSSKKIHIYHNIEKTLKALSLAFRAFLTTLYQVSLSGFPFTFSGRTASPSFPEPGWLSEGS